MLARMRSKGDFPSLLVGIQNSTQPLGRPFGSVLQKLSTFLQYDPAIVLLGIYVNDLKTCVTQNPAHENL